MVKKIHRKYHYFSTVLLFFTFIHFMHKEESMQLDIIAILFDLLPFYQISQRAPASKIPHKFVLNRYVEVVPKPIPYKYLRRICHFPDLIPEWYLVLPNYSRPTHVYTIVSNAFIDCSGSIFCGGNTIYYFNEKWSKNLGTFNNYKQVNIGYTILGDENKYGHIVNDEIMQIGNIPWEVVEKGYLLVSNERYSLSLAALQIIFNTTTPKIIRYYNDKDLVFCSYHVTFESVPLWNIAGYYAPQKICTILKERLGITDIEPTKYIISNRQPGLCRVIPNFKELSQAIINHYPKIDWIIMEDYIRGFANTIIYWNTIKFIYGPNGSNMINCYFMRPGTVIVMVRPITASDAADNTAAATTGIWMYTYPQEGWTHWGILKNDANISRAITFVGYGLYTLENQKWPDKFILPRLPVVNESYPLNCKEAYCSYEIPYKFNI